MGTDYRSIPGLYAGNSLRTRNIFTNLSPAQVQLVPSLAIIDGSLSRDVGETPTNVLRAGLLLGKVTSGGKYRNAIIGLTNGAITAGSATTITVPAAVATEVARLISVAGGNVSLKLTGPPSAGGTVASTSITATAATGTTITISSATLPACVDKSLIQPADGSQTIVTVLPNAAGLDVNDSSGANLDQALQQYLRGADLIASMLIAGSTDITGLDSSLQTWIKTALKAAGYFTFDNDR